MAPSKLDQYKKEVKKLGLYFTEEEAAGHLNFSRIFLRHLRSRNEGPRFIRIKRAIRYKRADLDAWMDQNTVETEGRFARAQS